MTSVLNRRCHTVARKTEITILFAIAELGLIDEHGKTTAIGRHAPNLASGRWNVPITGDKAPYRGGS
jgi:hypothetical protein